MFLKLIIQVLFDAKPQSYNSLSEKQLLTTRQLPFSPPESKVIALPCRIEPFFFLSFFISIYERVHIPNPPKKISTPPQKGNPKPIRFHHFSVSTRRSGSTTSEMPGNGVGWSNPTKLLLLWGNPPLNGVIWGYNPLTLNLAFLKYIEIGINVEEWDRNDHKLKVSIFSDLHFFFWAWITDILNEGPPPPKWWLQ